MLTVVWNPDGFHSIDVLPNGSKFNTGHYISHILSLLPEILALYQDGPKRYFVIHVDNTRSHYVKTVTRFSIAIPSAERFILLIRQIWLLLTSDFWLFGYLKEGPQQSSFEEYD
jgi:hypothetical protein